MHLQIVHFDPHLVLCQFVLVSTQPLSWKQRLHLVNIGKELFRITFAIYTSFMHRH